jgi:hypothetical protein
VAPIYAGILGPLAFSTMIARGLVHGGGMDAVLLPAWCSLLLFATIGLMIGWLAEWVVADSVRTKIRIELAAGDAESARSAPPEPAGN